MNYELVKSTNKDISRLIEYKKYTTLEYANNLSNEELSEINNYINNEVVNNFNNYYNVIIDNKVIGSLLVLSIKGGLLIEEIYIEEDYRNKGIGSNILKDIINNNLNTNIYLWVYKDNIKAISLYKKLGFNIIDETESRYYMKYNNKEGE